MKNIHKVCSKLTEYEKIRYLPQLIRSLKFHVFQSLSSSVSCALSSARQGLLLKPGSQKEKKTEQNPSLPVAKQNHACHTVDTCIPICMCTGKKKKASKASKRPHTKLLKMLISSTYTSIIFTLLNEYVLLFFPLFFNYPCWSLFNIAEIKL